MTTSFSDLTYCMPLAVPNSIAPEEGSPGNTAKRTSAHKAMASSGIEIEAVLTPRPCPYLERNQNSFRIVTFSSTTRKTSHRVKILTCAGRG